jgi:hypothetical protein
MAKSEAGGSGGATPHHVLVAAADVGRDDLQNGPVVQLATHVRRIDAGSVLELEFRIVKVFYLDVARASINYSSVVWHG